MLRLIFALIFFVFPFHCNGAEKTSHKTEKKQKICLNMIVKDESRVIKRCLDSVKEVIDYWVIVDTGSTDGTQKIIESYLKDIPGKLYQSEWKNWAVNRNEALQLAKGKADYILLMDADDILVFKNKQEFPPLTQDLYNMWRGATGFTYIKHQLIRDGLPWKWVGVTHEYLDCERPYSSALLEQVKYVTHDDGAGSYDPKKFRKNVDLLVEGLKEEPHNSRYVFYLAESYRDSGEKAKAIEFYQKRVNMGGWDEEVFWSKLQIARMLQEVGVAQCILEASYLDAHTSRPHRVEPVYHLAELYNQQQNYVKSYEIVKKFLSTPQPKVKDSLFNMDWMQHYGLLCQLSISSYYIGKYEESLATIDKLLAMESLPEGWREQSKINRTFSVAKLEEAKEKGSLIKKIVKAR